MEKMFLEKSNLEILACTAPHWVESAHDERQKIQNLGSSTPFSLQNAVRLACSKARKGIGHLGDSNWRYKNERQKSVLLLEYWENIKEDYINLIKLKKPNLLFIGTMTLGFPGAIELAKGAKSILGDKVITVVGGKHIIETTYLYEGEISTNRNCPLRMMKNGSIPKVFDFVVSGEGEGVICAIAESVGEMLKTKKPLKNAIELEDHFKQALGDWVLGWLDDNEEIQYRESCQKTMDVDNMPYPVELFDVKSNFPVFDSDMTAHAYSYISKGCPYDCFFCSERYSINGSLKSVGTAPDRLIEQFKLIQALGEERFGHRNVSAFIEDSILLGGSSNALSRLAKLLDENDVQIKFGGQLTIDMILHKKNQESIVQLARKGLSYIFFGIETMDEEIAQTMSKNTRQVSWHTRAEEAINFLRKCGIKCGVLMIFGLGESQDSRVKQMQQIKDWQNRWEAPHVVSLNYGTLHPLRNPVTNNKYLFTEWGTPQNSDYLSIFSQLFGEASVKYSLPNVSLPTIDELEELIEIYNEMCLQNT